MSGSKAREANCSFSNRDSEGVRDALDGLKHYHSVHSGEVCSRFESVVEVVNSDGEVEKETTTCGIYITSDPMWIRELNKLCKLLGPARNNTKPN